MCCGAPEDRWGCRGISFNGRVDLLAIDRDGVGDAHLVEIRQTLSDALASTEHLLEARAAYRWIAFFLGTEDTASEDALPSEDMKRHPARTALTRPTERAQ
jgi:hypothetical protein